MRCAKTAGRQDERWIPEGGAQSCHHQRDLPTFGGRELGTPWVSSPESGWLPTLRVARFLRHVSPNSHPRTGVRNLKTGLPRNERQRKEGPIMGTKRRSHTAYNSPPQPAQPLTSPWGAENRGMWGQEVLRSSRSHQALSKPSQYVGARELLGCGRPSQMPMVAGWAPCHCHLPQVGGHGLQPWFREAGAGLAPTPTAGKLHGRLQDTLVGGGRLLCASLFPFPRIHQLCHLTD